MSIRNGDVEAGASGFLESPDDVVERLVRTLPSSAVMFELERVDVRVLSDAGRICYVKTLERLQAWLSSLSTVPIAAMMAGARPLIAEGPMTMTQAEVQSLERGSAREELRVGLGWSDRMVRRRIEVAEALHGRFPATQAVLAAGEFSYWHAVTLVEETVALDDATAEDVEAAVLPKATGEPLVILRRALRRARVDLDEQAQLAAHEVAVRHRQVLRKPLSDGMAELVVTAPAPDVQVIWQALTILAGDSDLVSASSSSVSGELTDPRSLDNRRVDALTRLCLEAVAPNVSVLQKAGGVTVAEPIAEEAGAQKHLPRPSKLPVSVQVVVDLPTLMGLADNPGVLRGYGPIPVDVARAWMTDATSWQRLVVDPVDDHLLDLGKKVYRPPPGLDSFVRARDGTCTFPLCHRAAARCDLDHCRPHRRDGSGGSTSAHNLGVLCRYHHRVKTFMQWRPRVESDRSVVWTSPAGHQYRVAPRSQTD